VGNASRDEAEPGHAEWVACFNCAEIDRVEQGNHAWAVARLATGYVWLNPVQYFEGSAFFVSKFCVAELVDMAVDDRTAHLLEMAEVAAAIVDAFGARKMNYEALGNTDPHLHWWLTPRRPSDPRPSRPIWEDLDFLRALWTKRPTVSDDQRCKLRTSLLNELRHRELPVERSFV
jgi:diadenosine tetraphosphate (Ap4A) HIT family hydrolase